MVIDDLYETVWRAKKVVYSRPDMDARFQAQELNYLFIWPPKKDVQKEAILQSRRYFATTIINPPYISLATNYFFNWAALKQ